MGFFSILYWLVGHPKRYLYIASFSRDSQGRYIAYEATIQEVNGVLAFKLKTIPGSEVTKTGVRMSLDAYDDPFTNKNVSTFYKQLEKLKFVKNTRIYSTISTSNVKSSVIGFGVEPQNAYDKSLFKGLRAWERSVFCFVTPNYLVSEDYATGIPVDILLGGLFTPSISTKTISMAEKMQGGKIQISIEDGLTKTRLIILVANIAVVSLKGKSVPGNNKSYIISMPPNTRLPVSRDDIILTPEARPSFQQAIYDLLVEAAKKYKMIDSLQDMLTKYSTYTASNEIKEAISAATSQFYQQYTHLLCPKEYRYLYAQLSPEFIGSNIYYAHAIERFLDALAGKVKSNTNIWKGINVIQVAITGDNVTSAHLIRYLFVSITYIKSNPKWVENITASYKDTTLLPVGSKLSIEEYKKYSDEVLNITLAPGQGQYPNKINRLKYDQEIAGYRAKASEFIVEPDVLLYYYSLLLKFESLFIYFDDIQTNMYLFKALLIKSYLFYGAERFSKIASAFFTRFSEFKGNQTYGGSKYMVKVRDYGSYYTSRQLTIKDYDFALTNVLTAIKAIKEEQTTTILTSNPNSHLWWLEQGKYELFEEIFKASNSLLEFTYVYVSSQPLFKTTTIIPIGALSSYVTSSLSKFRGGAFNKESYLVELYKLWDNQGFEGRVVYVFINKERIRAEEWLKNISQAVVSEAPTITQPKYKVGCKLSALIKTLFKEVPKDDQGLIDVFTQASKETDTTPLQVIEIATNEGTTKPFLEATLTELTQNSIDAIREASNVVKSVADNWKNNIDIDLRDVKGKNLVLSIKDSIGMPRDAFLYVGIPFLSTKSPSELVTGEMGSGFFNAYRESSQVTVDTCKNGIRRVSKDVPIRDGTGRVVDIAKEIDISGCKDNGTEISIHIPYTSEEDKLNKISTVQYVATRVLALANVPGQLYYQKSLVNIPKIHIADVGKFQIYVTDTTLYNQESYLLTKGVPFNPLAPYLAPYIDSSYLFLLESSVIVNIVHGGYTPVQTRTRISMPPDVEKDFVKVAVYSMFAIGLTMMHTGSLSKRTIDHIESKSSAEQLNFTLYDVMNFHKTATSDQFIKYTSLNGQPTIAALINTCIGIMKDKPYDKVKRKITAELNKYASGSKWIDDLVKNLVVEWLKPKNTAAVKKGTKTTMVEVNADEEDVDVPDEIVTGKLARAFKSWYAAYWKACVEAKVLDISGKPYTNSTKFPGTKVVISVKDKKSAGWYLKSTGDITINTYSIEDDDEEAMLKVLDTADIKDLQNTLVKPLIHNKVWKSFFAYQFPASTLPHEAEHFRRGSSHTTGAHDSIVGVVYQGDKSITRTFDQCANDIYKRTMEYGFLANFVSLYRGK